MNEFWKTLMILGDEAPLNALEIANIQQEGSQSLGI